MIDATALPQFSVADYAAAAQHIAGCSRRRPVVGLVLGSGLNALADQVTDAVIIPYADIPHFPLSTVPGHAGRMVLGQLGGVDVCIMQGRFHFYEGYSLAQITFPIRVMRRLGVSALVLTNAAGGLNPAFQAGDLMLIEDAINLLGLAGHNPLLGPNLDEFGPRFPASNRTYSQRLRELAITVARDEELPLQRGVYIMVAGPNFESPAEIRMLRGLGADAVGMSTAPEALVAHHAGMEVLAISTITNICIDTVDAAHEPSHEEVTEAGKLIVPRLSRLLVGVLDKLAAGDA